MDKTEQIDRLLSLIDDIVSGDEPWQDKRAAVLAQCSDDLRIALEEFATWFSEDLTDEVAEDPAPQHKR